MKHEHEPTFAFPSDLSDREATTLCDFLFQLAGDADALRKFVVFLGHGVDEHLALAANHVGLRRRGCRRES